MGLVKEQYRLRPATSHDWLEGTLGVIVEATIRLPKHHRQAVMVLGAPSMNAVMDILSVFQRRSIGGLEFFSEEALSKVVDHASVRRPFGTICPFYALLEFKVSTTVMRAGAQTLRKMLGQEGGRRRHESKSSSGGRYAVEKTSRRFRVGRRIRMMCR